MQKQPSCIKRVRPSKSLGEKSCEIKGGGYEMTAMMLINFIMHKVIIKIYCHPHHCSHIMAATFDFTTFFTQAV